MNQRLAISPWLVALLAAAGVSAAAFGDMRYSSQQRSIRGWIAIGTDVVVYDETVSAPGFTPFDETLIHGYNGTGQSASVRVTQTSRLDSNEIRFVGEAFGLNQHQQPFSSPGSVATSRLTVTFSLADPIDFELSGTIVGGFRSVYREYSVAFTSGAQTIVSRSSAGGIHWVDLDLTGSSAIRGTLPVGTYQLAILVQTSGGVRDGGTTTYDLSLRVPSPTSIALPLAALPLAIRRRRDATASCGE